MIQEGLYMQCYKCGSEEKKVSIIVPIYNSEQYLEKCLDSLIKQTLGEIEIILVDDASTDKSNQIIKVYQEKYPNMIRALYQTENAGQGVARNIGLDAAIGDYIMFVDSDDYVEHTICEKLYLIALKHQSDIVCCEYYETDCLRIREISPYSSQVMGDLNEEKRSLLISVHAVGPCAKLVRRQLLIENKLYFPEGMKYEDLATIPLWWVYAQRIDEVKEPLYHYIRHEASTTIKKNSANYYDIFKAALCISERFSERKLQEKYKECINHLLLRGFIDEIKLLTENVNQPDCQELQWLYKKVEELIPQYKMFSIMYMRCDPKTIVMADLFMNDMQRYIDTLKMGDFSQISYSYCHYYQLCIDSFQYLQKYCLQNQYRIAIWGAGQKGKDFLETLDANASIISYVIDKNPKQWNRRMDSGHLIKCFDDVYNQIDVVLVMNRVYFGGIYREIKDKSPQIKVINLDMYFMMLHREQLENFFE